AVWRAAGGAVRDDGQAVARDAARVAARENRRPFAVLEQEPRDVAHRRRFAAAAHAQAADADDGAAEPPAPPGRMRVPAAPPCRCRSVCGAQYVDQCTRRKGRTTAPPPAGGSSSAVTARGLIFGPRV